MKSIKARFEAFRKKNPGHGDYINMANAVKGQNFTKDMISRWFTKLVPKDEYAKKDKKSLIDQLVAHSKCAEERSFEGVKAPGKHAKKKVEELHKEGLVELPVKKVTNNYYGEND